MIELPPNQQGILDDFSQRPVSGPTIDGRDFAGNVRLARPTGEEAENTCSFRPAKGAVPDDTSCIAR